MDFVRNQHYAIGLKNVKQRLQLSARPRTPNRIMRVAQQHELCPFPAMALNPLQIHDVTSVLPAKQRAFSHNPVVLAH